MPKTVLVVHSSDGGGGATVAYSVRDAWRASWTGRDGWRAGRGASGLRNVAASERGVAADRMGSRDAGWPLLPEETRGRDGSALYRSELEGSRS